MQSQTNQNLLNHRNLKEALIQTDTARCRNARKWRIECDAMKRKWKWKWKWKRKNDLSVFVNGGDEIGEEIEAEEWLGRFVRGGSDYGFQLRHQYAEPR